MQKGRTYAWSASWCANQPLASSPTGIIPVVVVFGAKIEVSVMPRTSKMSC